MEIHQNPFPLIEILKDANDCANYFVYITGCKKSDALKVFLDLYAKEINRDFSLLIELVPPEWMNNE